GGRCHVLLHRRVDHAAQVLPAGLCHHVDRAAQQILTATRNGRILAGQVGLRRQSQRSGHGHPMVGEDAAHSGAVELLRGGQRNLQQIEPCCLGTGGSGDETGFIELAGEHQAMNAYLHDETPYMMVIGRAGCVVRSGCRGRPRGPGRWWAMAAASGRVHRVWNTSRRHAGGIITPGAPSAAGRGHCVGGGWAASAPVCSSSGLRRRRRKNEPAGRPLTSEAPSSTAPRARYCSWAPALPGTTSRMEASSQVISRAAKRMPLSRPTPPVIATPPSTAMVMAGSAIPAPLDPASGRAEANCATVYTPTRPATAPEPTKASICVRRVLIPDQCAAVVFVPMPYRLRP